MTGTGALFSQPVKQRFFHTCPLPMERRGIFLQDYRDYRDYYSVSVIRKESVIGTTLEV